MTLAMCKPELTYLYDCLIKFKKSSNYDNLNHHFAVINLRRILIES